MDVLKNKKYENFDYICRQSGRPYYYHTLDNKYIYGLGTNVRKDSPYTLHKVKETDTLDSLALDYYNNPTLYWIICYFNDIEDSLVDLYPKYKTLKIPNYSSLQFGDER